MIIPQSSAWKTVHALFSLWVSIRISWVFHCNHTCPNMILCFGTVCVNGHDGVTFCFCEVYAYIVVSRVESPFWWVFIISLIGLWLHLWFVLMSLFRCIAWSTGIVPAMSIIRGACWSLKTQEWPGTRINFLLRGCAWLVGRQFAVSEWHKFVRIVWCKSSSSDDIIITPTPARPCTGRQRCTAGTGGFAVA
jgi:hypothetical protein